MGSGLWPGPLALVMLEAASPPPRAGTLPSRSLQWHLWLLVFGELLKPGADYGLNSGSATILPGDLGQVTPS